MTKTKEEQQEVGRVVLLSTSCALALLASLMFLPAIPTILRILLGVGGVCGLIGFVGICLGFYGPGEH